MEKEVSAEESESMPDSKQLKDMDSYSEISYPCNDAAVEIFRSLDNSDDDIILMSALVQLNSGQDDYLTNLDCQGMVNGDMEVRRSLDSPRSTMLRSDQVGAMAQAVCYDRETGRSSYARQDGREGIRLIRCPSQEGAGALEFFLDELQASIDEYMMQAVSPLTHLSFPKS